MTRRRLLAAFGLAFCSVSAFPAAARAAGGTKPLEVTYYYLPG